MVTQTFPGIAPVVLATQAFDFRLDKFRAVNGFYTGVDAISPAVAGNIFNIRVRNPASSGKRVILTRLIMSSSVAAFLREDEIELDGVINLANVRTHFHRSFSATSSVAVVSDQANTPGQGVGSPVGVNVQANAIADILLGIVLEQGTQQDFSMSDTVITTVYRYLLEWYQEPVP